MTTMTPTTTPKDQQITSLQAILRDPTKRSQLLSDDDKCAKLCEADHLQPIIEAAIMEDDELGSAIANAKSAQPDPPAEIVVPDADEKRERKAAKKAA